MMGNMPEGNMPEQGAEEDRPDNYELAILFGLAFNVLIDELHTRLAQLGYTDIRPAHGFVFQAIGSAGATASQIAQHLGNTKQAASQIVDYLVDAGYLARHPHPHDRRGKLLHLTERGWRCLEESGAILRDIERRWATVLGAERLEHLRHDLVLLLRDAKTAGDGEAMRASAPLPGIRPVW